MTGFNVEVQGEKDPVFIVDKDLTGEYPILFSEDGCQFWVDLVEDENGVLMFPKVRRLSMPGAPLEMSLLLA